MNSAFAWALWAAAWLQGAPAGEASEATTQGLRRHESVVIVASVLDPRLDRRNRAVFEQTLFSRDDQLLNTLTAGIDAGQHEGGGKSLEVRRFGFNLDHGGVGGGLKVLVDDVPQNQSTQGHGQGYLGGLKSVTPELIDEVDILNGPFSAEYGDFSGLGVVHIRMKESLADAFTARLQRVGVWQALRMMTSGAAYALHQDSVLGTLTVGKQADLIVVSADPLTVDPNTLDGLRVLSTVVGGRTEYCAPGAETVCGP